MHYSKLDSVGCLIYHRHRGYSQSVNSGATATISLSVNQNGPQTIAIGGTKTTGDTITITVCDAGLAGGLKAVTYTVLAGDTLSTIASGLASALTADANLQGAGISATPSGTVVTLQSNSINATTLRATTSATATELVALNIPANGTQTAVIGGTKTTGDVLTVTTFDSGLAEGSQGVNYTVLAGDTLTTIAAGLATAINGSANLTAIGVTATSSSTVLNIKSTSTNSTTYTKSLSGGATETIALAPASGVAQYGYNNLNELTSIATGGATKFQANTNKALKSATINSNAANLDWSQSFSGNATLANGGNTIPVSATDGASNVVTNNYQVGVTGPSSSSLTFDANGNMTSDGVKAFAWDAANRLIKITYPGSGNFSQILYDANGVKGQITETVASTLTSTKQFVNSGSIICEERDASSTVTKKFFGRGQTISGSNYFYDFDHLGSIRDMTDSSGLVQAHYEYDLYGQRTKTSGAQDSDFQYAGYYMYTPSGLNLTVYRGYNPSSGRWINRDPIQEQGGVNLYGYAVNQPTTVVDPSGLEFYPATPSGYSSFAHDAGLNASMLGAGCRDVVNQAVGVTPGGYPENAGNTKCWLGAKGFDKARHHKCCNGNPPVVWGHQGFGAAGAGTEGGYSGSYSPSDISPFASQETSGGNAYNYILYSNNSFVGMTAGSANGGQGYINPVGPDPSPPHLSIWNGRPMDTQMWCATCR